MQHHVFKMMLNPGCVREYKRRHDAIWPELSALLRDAGVRDYAIHYDPDTHALIGTLWRPEGHSMDDLPNHPVMQKWWAYMADIMDTHPDNRPKETPLIPVFHMP
ncbi:L-rhamnose mutarotase [Thioclava sp. SK-1]|uniref:L-rhamnose mutarotase n=1 Tax=Thioclava sp. SK-1 TaxID=1889770 RepID=UPI0008246D88|nr:L-rhamnose mutarotase [Thioclava sp. SK-1]OCX66948.1 L-rhamnose mutarotase [Thioclava sp. SK-1]